MNDLDDLFASNRDWREARLKEDPDYFNKLACQHAPKYLWIGCADARVPANEILGLPPGEVFVHRNIANLVVHSDFNAQSVIQFAVDVLKVEHIMVVGHYGCSGVEAALQGARIGLADNWLRHIQDVRDRHRALLDAIAGPHRHDALVELNAIEQVVNLAQSTVLLDAWGRGQRVSLHGWVYGVHDGLLKDLQINVEGVDALEAAYRRAVAGVSALARG